MSDKIRILLIGYGETIEREIDKFDPMVPEYQVLSPTTRAVYHASDKDQDGQHIYEYVGMESKQYPPLGRGA